MLKKLLFIIVLVLGIIWLVKTLTSNTSLSAVPQQVLAEEVNRDRVRLVEYTPERFAQFSDQRRILFFAAAWCGNCFEAEKDLEARTAELPADVTLFKANFDLEKELVKKYNVAYQHTYVLVSATGEAITMWNGGDTDEVLEYLQQ